MTELQKEAKINRADKFAIKLRNAGSEEELTRLIEDVIYVLIAGLDSSHEKRFKILFDEASYDYEFSKDLQTDFENQKKTLIAILEKFKEFVRTG